MELVSAEVQKDGRKVCYVRMTDSEYKRLQKMIATTGKKAPELFRVALFSRTDLLQPLMLPEDVHQLKVEMNRQGNNINQMTKQMNQDARIGWNASFDHFTSAYGSMRALILRNRGHI